MFLSKKLREMGVKLSQGITSFSEKEVNEGIDALGLPFGFKYSQRFLFKSFELLPTVEKVGDNTYRVPSEGTPGQVYSVGLAPFSCECPAFQRFKIAGYPFCKHVTAAMLRDQAVEGMEFEEFMDRWNNGNYKWGHRNSEFGIRNSELKEESIPNSSLVSVFSSSQLDAYTRCPASYYFRYQKRVPDESSLSSALAFDRCLKATIYAHFGYEPDPNIPLEDKWKPELDVAVDALSEGMKIDEVFAETFCWLCEKKAVDWADEKEEGEMLKRGGVLAKSFDQEFGEMSAEPLISMRTTMVDTSTGALVQSNGSPVSVQCSLDLISNDGVILKLKTSSRSISKLEYEWALDLQRYVYEQTKRQVPTGVKVVNLVRTKNPKMQVIDAPEPRISRTLAICESVIASINANAFYPNPKNQFGCSKCGYLSECEKQW